MLLRSGFNTTTTKTIIITTTITTTTITTITTITTRISKKSNNANSTINNLNYRVLSSGKTIHTPSIALKIPSSCPKERSNRRKKRRETRVFSRVELLGLRHVLFVDIFVLDARFRPKTPLNLVASLFYSEEKISEFKRSFRR